VGGVLVCVICSYNKTGKGVALAGRRVLCLRLHTRSTVQSIWSCFLLDSNLEAL
jgi:hypothetical protein